MARWLNMNAYTHMYLDNLQRHLNRLKSELKSSLQIFSDNSTRN